MTSSTPRYLLYSESDTAQGTWKFVLRRPSGADVLTVADREPEVHGDRLELLSVVRGLEALDQPSRVTLVTPSKYVREGIRYGLAQWQSNGWRWEFFGEMVPVKNRDLWQRIQRAMQFHRVECRTWRFDAAHARGAPAFQRHGQADRRAFRAGTPARAAARDDAYRVRLWGPWLRLPRQFGGLAAWLGRVGDSLKRRWRALVPRVRFG